MEQLDAAARWDVDEWQQVPLQERLMLLYQLTGPLMIGLGSARREVEGDGGEQGPIEEAVDRFTEAAENALTVMTDCLVGAIGLLAAQEQLEETV